MQIKIGKNIISIDTEPFVIAEIGSNFDQNLKKAYKLISIAKNCGADAVKFQLFNSELLYPNDLKMQKIFKQNELNPLWVGKLAKYCKRIKINFFLSPFDEKSFYLIKKNKIKFYKIASSEITNFSLIEMIAKENKPILLSTGASDLDDINKAVRIINKYKNFQIIIMQCCSLYPLQNKLANINVLDTYKKKFKNLIGFSDHTLGFEASILALGKGARVFEKHITLNKKSPGPDHHFALNPREFRNYVTKIKESFKMLGSYEKDMLPEEKKINRREGLYFNRNMKKNSKINKNDLYVSRPCLGIRAKYLRKVLNKKVIKNVKKNYPVLSNILK